MSETQTTQDGGRILRAGIAAWSIVGMALVGAGIFWLLDQISGALTPFVMAVVLVLMLRRPVAWLVSLKIPRTAAVTVCYIAGFAALGILSASVFPLLGSQIAEFIHDFPGYYEAAREFLLDMEAEFSAISIPGWATKAINELGSTITSQFASWSRAAASGVVSAGSATLGFAFNSIFALVLGFWMLKDMEPIKAEFYSLLGEKRRAEGEMIVTNVLNVLGGYLKGQALVSLITGVLTAIGLALLGVPYALVLGLITGVLNIIPYIGAFTGGLISAIVAAFIGPWVAVGAVVVTVIAQQVTDLFVTPRVMSEKVDLHPLLVILSLLVGGALFGFWGLVIAIPTAAILKGLFVYYYEKHTKRTLSSEQGAIFKKKPADDGVAVSVEVMPTEMGEPSAEERD